MGSFRVTEHMSATLLDHRGIAGADSKSTHTARVMLCDDEPAIIEVLTVYLEDAGYTNIVATSDASRAMGLLRASPPDILITDLMMPEVDGFEILRKMRADLHLSRVPVIILTAYNDPDNKLRALELGATDFLSKPVDSSELELRVRNSLAAKFYQDQLQKAYQRSHRLLLGILPPSVAERLELGDTNVVDYFAEVTVLFADLTGFTRLASETEVTAAVQHRNHVFKAFDQLVDERGVDKIKTIGDSYLLVGGLTHRSADHARTVVDAGQAMLSIAERMAADAGANFRLRIGVHTGPVVAGVMGANNFYYDLWGDTVNVASRMKSTSGHGQIQISDVTRRIVGDDFEVEARDASDFKGMGGMDTFYVLGRGS
jgi:adenylate cyclase